GVVLALLVGGFIGTTLDQAVRWAGLAFTSCVIVAVIVFALTLIRREGLGEPDPAGVAAPAVATPEGRRQARRSQPCMHPSRSPARSSTGHSTTSLGPEHAARPGPLYVGERRERCKPREALRYPPG